MMSRLFKVTYCLSTDVCDLTLPHLVGVCLTQRPMGLTPRLNIESCTQLWRCLAHSLTSLCVCTSPLSSLQSWRLLSPKLPCGLCFISSSLQDLLSTSLLCSQLLSTPTKVWLPRSHPYRLRLDHSLECMGFFYFFIFFFISI